MRVGNMEKSNGPITNNKRRLFLLIFIFLVITGFLGLYFYLAYRNTHISTDDAYVTGPIHIIASKVPGTVKKIYVTDDQHVNEGDILLEIDNRDYDVRARETESSVNSEQAKSNEFALRANAAKQQLIELRYRVDSAKANLKLQEVNLKQAESDLQRAEKLFSRGIIPEERMERATTVHDSAAAQVEAARDQLKQAEAAVATQKIVIQQSESAVNSQKSLVKQKEETHTAENLKLSYTKIYAPSNGYITRKNVEVGNQIQSGQPLLAVVPLSDVWIVANYKETQLENVKPGQKVAIEVDTYPGKTFTGKVESIMAGSGSTFSLFPPENATGSYVKVVQRIPVKIVLDNKTDHNHVLRVGMSVIPTILVNK
jgi:membrane fusion protein (multidrug efflux system)